MSKPKPTALDAARDESASVTATWRGLTFTVPPAKDWPVEVYEALEDDKVIGATRQLLGPEQWAAFKASTPAPTLADFQTLSELLAGGGPTVGESDASSDS